MLLSALLRPLAELARWAVGSGDAGRVRAALPLAALALAMVGLAGASWLGLEALGAAGARVLPVTPVLASLGLLGAFLALLCAHRVLPALRTGAAVAVLCARGLGGLYLTLALLAGVRPGDAPSAFAVAGGVFAVSFVVGLPPRRKRRRVVTDGATAPGGGDARPATVTA